MSFGTGLSEKDAINRLIGTANEVKGTAGEMKGTAGEVKGTAGQVKDTAGKLLGLGDTAEGRGSRSWQFFKESAKPTMNYWKNILGGDNSALMEFLGPEASGIKESYAAPLRSMGEFGPRGGGQASAVGTLQEGEARSMGDLFGKARPQAAEHLGGLASLFQQGALGFGGQAIGAEGAAGGLQTSAGGLEEGAGQLEQGAGSLQLGAGGLQGGALSAIQTGRQRTSDFWGEIGGAAGTAAAGLACCFIFLEALNGPLPWYVRECRDEYYEKEPLIARGYIRMSTILVPLMRKYTTIRYIVNKIMVSPIIYYGAFLKGVEGGREDRRIYKEFWFRVWKFIGRF